MSGCWGCGRHKRVKQFIGFIDVLKLCIDMQSIVYTKQLIGKNNKMLEKGMLRFLAKEDISKIFASVSIYNKKFSTLALALIAR